MKKAIREGEITIGNVVLHVAVLDSGERVFVGNEVLKLFAPEAKYTQEEVKEGLREMKLL